ncbi:hypothetical protein C2E23DRAFT_54591 [Lenzites betulinus]|nr:hypothetical protein C2E23DRAFT_54591 [Lenzites betulinus]
MSSPSLTTVDRPSDRRTSSAVHTLSCRIHPRPPAIAHLAMWAEHTTMLITYDPLCAPSQLGCRLQVLRRSRLPAGSTLLHHAYTYTHADTALRTPGFSTGAAPHTGSRQAEGPIPTPARSGRGPTRLPPERAQRALSRRRAEGPQTQSSRAPSTVPPD